MPPSTTEVAAQKLVRVGVLSSIAKLDPREAVDNVSGMVLGQIFEPPYGLAAGDSRVTPLVLEPLRRESPEQYSAAVRSGVRFSDGTPLTAEHVVRSLRGAKAFTSKATAEVRDGRVWFRLLVPNPRFDLFLTQGNCGIVLDQSGQLLGTGPFQFEGRPDLRALQQATSVRLVRNEHRTSASSIDELHFIVCPAEADGTPRSLIEALRDNRVDVTNALTMPQLTGQQIPRITPSLQPGNSTGILFFNTERTYLRDAVVRRGVALALDHNAIAAASFDKNPLAFIATTILPPLMGRSTGVASKDVAEASRLLGNSVATLPKLSLLVPWAPRPYMPAPLPVAALIQKQLAEVRVRVEIQQPETAEQFFDALVRGHYDLALAGWIADTPDPADFYEALLWSKMCEGENHSNHSRWKNAAADEALLLYRENPSDENRRELDRIVRDEAPLVPLVYGQSVVVHSRRIRSIHVSATGVLSFGQVTLTP